MESQNNIVFQKSKSRLPIIALVFGFAPIILLLLSWIPYLGIIFIYLFFGSWWGISFQVVGLIIGVFALWLRAIKNKYIGVIGVIFSIIAILSPFIWWQIVWALYRGGMEIFL